MISVELVLLCKAKIDDINRIILFILTDQKVIRFDIPMNKAL